MISPQSQERIRSILQDLDSVRENLLALSDDIWLSIDHNNNEAMEQGIEFKREYNDKVEDFARIAEDLSVMVRQFTNVPTVREETESTENSSETNERIIAELDRLEPHSLNEDFTYKRPYGYRLADRAVTGTETWRALYEDLLLYLREKAPEIFASLPDRPETVSRRGNPYFARDKENLRVASPLSDDIYMEINLSAQMITTMVQTLLPFFGFESENMQIYLREDRDA